MSSPAAFLEGQPAGLSVIASGQATIPNAGYQTPAIAVAGLTAGAIIVVSGVGAAQAVGAATSFSADVVGAGSFVINSDQAATADKVVSWAVLRM
jgi:hypothetical protein